MYSRKRQETLQYQGRDVRRSSNSHRRRAPTYIDPSPGSFSAPVARLSKWPKNVYFASDFIADKAAAVTAAGGVRRRAPRQRGTGANKAKHGPRGTGGRHESATRMKKTQSTAPPSSGGRRTAHHQNVEGHMEREEMGPAVVDDGEGELFLEESASALLLLHTRFFGGISQEEDMVCRLCMLCREAGWMGSPLLVCPDLDPIVLDNMVVAQLRGGHRNDEGWRPNTTPSNSDRVREDLPSSDDGLSFEAFYRILSQVASLVYPLERRAMHRLLMEGVLPLAAESEPRRWMHRPEVLYGRPALAALRVQRDALRELYYTYDSIEKTHDTGSSGINRSLFLKMLTDLGVSPASISEQNAASIFDDVVRNGLPDVADTFLTLKLQQSRRAGNGGDDFMKTGGHGRVHSSSRNPGGDRLCWSLFLEAMAALAVGAVKDGHDAPAQRDRSHQPKMSNPDRWDKKDRGSDTRGMEVDLHEVRMLSPEEPHILEGRESALLGGEPSRSLEGDRERPPHEVSAEEHVFREDKTGTRVVAQQAGAAHATAEPSSAIDDHPPKYGRDFYHDSRRSLELMPTLQETDGSSEQTRSPSRSRAPPSRQQETTQEQGSNDKVKPSLSATRPSYPLPPRKVTTAAVAAAERNDAVATVAHLIVDSKPRRTSLHAKGQEHLLVEHLPPTTAKKAAHATSSEYKQRPIEAPLMGDSPLNGHREFLSTSKEDSGKDTGIMLLSPAPCHGGSPSAIPITAVASEALQVLGGPASRRAVVVDLGLPPPQQPPPGLHLDLGTFSSRHDDAREESVQNESEGLLYPCCDGDVYRFEGRDGPEIEVSGLGGDTDDKEEARTGWISHPEHFTMDVEAAGCTPALYEELLEPRVASVYSRHRKDLLTFFQRYRIGRGGSRLPVACDQETYGCIDYSGIWRFVNDFPVLRQWTQGDSILRLVVRASCGRGWQYCGEEEPVRRQHPLGLSYFGFLEVLTRMAYSTQGQRPLHQKLLGLIRALKVGRPGDNIPLNSSTHRPDQLRSEIKGKKCATTVGKQLAPSPPSRP